MNERNTPDASSKTPNGTLGDKIANAFDGHDDPIAGGSIVPRMRSTEHKKFFFFFIVPRMRIIRRNDDPDREPLDRAANALDGTDDPIAGRSIVPRMHSTEPMTPIAGRSIVQSN